jgi:hypothetical protein
LIKSIGKENALSLGFGLVERGQQQAGQNGNDRDYYQQLD